MLAQAFLSTSKTWNKSHKLKCLRACELAGLLGDAAGTNSPALKVFGQFECIYETRMIYVCTDVFILSTKNSMDCFQIDESGYTGFDLSNPEKRFQGASAIAINDDDGQ